MSQNWRDWCVVDEEKPGVDYRDEGKHTGRNDLLFVEKMIRYDTRCCLNVRSKADMSQLSIPHGTNNRKV